MKMERIEDVMGQEKENSDGDGTGIERFLLMRPKQY